MFKKLFPKKQKDISGVCDKSGDVKLPANITTKLNMLQKYIENSSDIIVRSFIIKAEQDINAAVIYMQGVIDTQFLNQDIIKPLMKFNEKEQSFNDNNLLDYITKRLVSIGQIKKKASLDETVQCIYDGLTVLIVNGISEVIVFDIRGGETRTLDEPLLDRTICGPREGFVESLTTNIALIRRKLRDTNLAVEKLIIGKRTRTDVAIMYIKDIANPEIVNEVLNRIKKIEMDGILSTGYINQFIEDNPRSLFPLYREIERADIAVAELLEGRVVIISDQSPLAIVYPALFVEMLQAAEDYSTKTQQGILMRLFRYVAFFSAVSLPALYISLISFYQELIPYELLIPIAKNRSEVPFPAVVEVLILEIVVQIIFEAGLRMPSPLGQTMGVVAGIILGQAIVSASFVSPAIIIVAATATISTFAISNFCMAITSRLLRLIFIATVAVFGIFGFTMTWLFLIVHLANQSSMGVPYFAPYAPFNFSDLKDSFIRSSIFSFKKRPESVPNINKRRQGNFRRGEQDNEN